MRMYYLLMAFLLLTVLTISVSARRMHEPVSEEVRHQQINTSLKTHPNTIALCVKGLLCPSCAIGMRDKVQKLDFIDTERFKKGVFMDAKNQILLVAVRSDTYADYTQLTKAIKAAGYKAVHIFIKNGKKIMRIDI